MRTGAPSVRQAARDAAERLEQAGVPDPAASAEVLLSELLGIGRGEIALREGPLPDEQAALYGAWISRRLEREPVQRILGYAYFRNLKLNLNEDTLIPRPDTESVVDLALERVDLRGSCRVLDVGTGSGAIAISIAQERPLCEVHATDISEAALEISRRNAQQNRATVHFHRADVASGLGSLDGTVDLLVSNPPYVDELSAERRLAPEVREWDPPAALYSGSDELAFFRRIFAETPPLLADGADVVLEIGDEQAEAVLDLGRRAGFVPLGTRPDLAGTPRAVLLRWGAMKGGASPTEVAEALRGGKVALVPTETVVGLVAAEIGLPRILEIKGRDANKPVALLCTSAEEAFALAAGVPPLARRLASLYWPGPLTLVLDRAGGGTIGVRVPEGPTVRAVLEAYGGPLYATSANRSGEAAPKGLEDVDPEMPEAVDLIVEGEPGTGKASAVVDLSGGQVRLLRATEDLSEERLARLARG